MALKNPFAMITFSTIAIITPMPRSSSFFWAKSAVLLKAQAVREFVSASLVASAATASAAVKHRQSRGALGKVHTAHTCVLEQAWSDWLV
jgi:hypothetical protein